MFKYKITSKNTIGFPIECLNKVLSVLKYNNISVIVINNNVNYIKYEMINNNYSKIINNALEFYNEKIAKESLYKNIDDKLSIDFSAFYKIKTFIDNLN